MLSLQAFGQTSEDALRYTSTGLGVGSRALGMGDAYIGVADDYSAVYWNPAGLAQMRRLEFTGSIFNTSYQDKASFLGNTEDGKNSATSLNDLGFVFPVPTERGSLVLALGYNRINDFTSALSFNGFNTKSSILPSLFDQDPDYDIPFQVSLEDTTGAINILKNVNQSGVVQASGSIGDWAFSGAIDVEEDLSFGITLNILSGSYSYTRNYLEQDTRNFYSDPRATVPIDSAYKKFDKFYYDSFISDDLSGVNAIFGMMYRWHDLARFGITIKTPTSMSVHESYTNSGQSVFDNGFIPTDVNGNSYTQYSYTVPNNDYGVNSSWVFGFGASVTPIDGLLLAGDVEYTDWTQIEWTDNQDLENDPDVGNSVLKNLFRATTNLRGGAEYQIPTTGLRLRAGYMYEPSPYAGDPSSYATKIATAGIGILLQDNVQLDAAAAFLSYKTYHNNYSSSDIVDPSRTDESISSTNVNFTISYRF
jgi:long-subunit fatty acid transport protein